MRLLLAQLNPTIGAFKANGDKIIQAIAEGRRQGCDLVIFPELTLCGYPPEDLLHLQSFMDAMQEQLQRVAEATEGIGVVLGLARYNPEQKGKRLLNSAAFIQERKIVGFVDKALLPTYDVFDETRYFEPIQQAHVWEFKGKRIGITICEDIWKHGTHFENYGYAYDPVTQLASLQPDLLLNLSASPYSLAKWAMRRAVAQAVVTTLHAPLVYCNQVGGNDSLIFDGRSFVVDAANQLVALAKPFAEDLLCVDLAACQPIEAEINPIEDLHNALVLGLRDYFRKSGFTKCCLGLSGGIDSAVVASIATVALGAENVLGLSMPSRYSSEGSRTDAVLLAKNLGIGYREISIEGPFQSFLDLLASHFQGMGSGITEENMQARIRGMLLMAFSNKLGYIVLSTGNKSEIATGYCTLYGDTCGGLGVLSDVSKNQVYALAHWINRQHVVIPKNTLIKPPSAELRPNQKDSDSLPDYEIIDQVLKDYVEELRPPALIAESHSYDQKVVDDLVKRIHANEYKRRQLPPGLRVTQKAFSIGRRFPIVQDWVK